MKDASIFTVPPDFMVRSDCSAPQCLQNTIVMFTLIYYLLQNLQLSLFPNWQPANY